MLADTIKRTATGAVSRSLFNINTRREFDPFDFGAVGDDAADDAPAINAALEAARVAGGAMILSHDARHAIGSPLLAKPGMKLIASKGG